MWLSLSCLRTARPSGQETRLYRHKPGQSPRPSPNPNLAPNRRHQNGQRRKPRPDTPGVGMFFPCFPTSKKALRSLIQASAAWIVPLEPNAELSSSAFWSEAKKCPVEQFAIYFCFQRVESAPI